MVLDPTLQSVARRDQVQDTFLLSFLSSLLSSPLLPCPLLPCPLLPSPLLPLLSFSPAAAAADDDDDDFLPASSPASSSVPPPLPIFVSLARQVPTALVRRSSRNLLLPPPSPLLACDRQVTLPSFPGLFLIVFLLPPPSLLRSLTALSPAPQSSLPPRLVDSSACSPLIFLAQVGTRG
eukprot:763591-Hanusia_phi.AAC.2